ncbi:MAG: phenylalanine--tRNA ligase subunit alpha [Chloracidobacterium sp.]|uniref:Phenylalanine--tRNA ligase alpha subunit n=1 Tax=Chloracidobacterium validum TaxID=2821543 RepID=A0ABX8B905_9BACT|nr:phenylalanine--tRNA ligase subunit alpha [Chloracidobacterium validum]QUW03417.1 phenylalanine--tRNA ligase subunit alpha [Chloracidobacterium validum]
MIDAPTLQAAIADSHQCLATAFRERFPEWTLPPLDLPSAPPRRQWQVVNDYWLSRKQGVLALKLKELGTLPPELRPVRGAALNAFKAEVDTALTGLEQQLQAYEAAETIRREAVDVTLPGLARRPGRAHPLTQIRERIEDIFVAMGYAVEDGPEVDTVFYNFDALNIPPDHPAREMTDTFYINEELALRSQTSNVQIHAMQRRRPPLRVIAPGRVFRRDEPDATHNPMFFQVEGLNVGRGITMADLKGTLQVFLTKLFERPVTLRFRPSYFPFVEPGAETDFQCIFCGGTGCRVCKHTGWIELGGSGMVHPNVLRACQIDPAEFSGFAFGFGIDRMAALLYGIDDIRLYFENDLRFLSQF